MILTPESIDELLVARKQIAGIAAWADDPPREGPL